MKVLTNIGIYPTDKVEVPKTIQEVLNDVLKILLKHVDLRAIYCFGYQSQSFTEHTIFWDASKQKQEKWWFNLLLIGKNIPTNSTANLADIVKQQSLQNINLTLLCYSSKQIALSNNEHRHLFKRIIQSGWLIYGKPHKLAHLNLINLPALNYKGIIHYTENRLRIGNELLKNAPLFFNQPLISAYMIKSSIEQLLLGIIYIYIHYHPNQFHIQYLFQLFINCCDLPEGKLTPTLFEQENFKKLWNTRYNDLRFRSSDIYTEESIQLFYQCCLLFKDQVEPVIQEQISQIKEKANEKEK